MVVRFEMISKDAANGGFHSVFIYVLFLFFLYSVYLSLLFTSFQVLFSVPTTRREAGPSKVLAFIRHAIYGV